MPLFHPGDIQQAWDSWTPTLSCSGSMTIGTTTIHRAAYKVVGKVCFMELRFAGTLADADASTVYATLPSGVGAKENSAVFFLNSAIDGDGSAHAGATLIQNVAGGGKLAFYKDTIGTNWQQGAAFDMYFSASFETE